ncbi:tripartite tricarboxylate transporter permease [Actinobacillus porcinus]|uniref:tripartite tricarboxylate transporter permease n=1 Tax=Actinobacillus porcinus TaxID=51048 RepID=UPI00235409A9|nr:tripartite tricarboxylate transporter permease [Actinobacillus porcinus]MDD7545059.1 tripartite tricarboxylate transporter permease [Actinobacillus porcinus]MDY5847733.1 tripartite tricarboxylate transporter permease [Actinobacillus porcinus]MDY6216565.1 tripartite tricarboxylate transporter permease [Actinobacillus porcinus]
METVFIALTNLANLQLLAWILIASIGGILIGSLPGLNATTGVALILPFTITMDPISAATIMLTIYCAATFAGAITAILINTPGTSASATTCLDGYPLVQKGEAGRALGIAAVSSGIGGVLSVICLMIAAPLLASIAYKFAPPEYLTLTIFAISMLATVGNSSVLKNLLSGMFGVLIATIGVDPLTTVDRFTFGIAALYDGIDIVPVMIGIFGISELFIQASVSAQSKDLVQIDKIKLPTWLDYKRIWKTILRSTGLGTFIGILPAEGATVASIVGYNEAKRWSKHPEEFGKGAIEGIAGSEAANNAATGGSMVPSLALGIPGSPTAAVILAGLMVHGINPGPNLFIEKGEIVYTIFWAMLLANVIFFFIGLFGAKLFARVTFIPTSILWPIVFVLCVVGSYAVNLSIVDIYISLIFGILGYFMRIFGFSVIPMTIGLILGGVLELRLGQTITMIKGDWFSILERPISVFFILATILALIMPMIRKYNQNK